MTESRDAKSGPPVLLDIVLCRDVARVGPANEPIYEYAMELCLELCWSLWTEPGSPGRALVDETAAKLVAIVRKRQQIIPPLKCLAGPPI